MTGPGQAETINRAIKVGGFDTVQATWNLLEQGASSALGAAHAAGMGVIIKEPLANGRLTAQGDVAALGNAASLSGCTPDALALAVVLLQPWADVVLSGAANVKEIEESNLTGLALQLDPRHVERLLDTLRQDSTATGGLDLPFLEFARRRLIQFEGDGRGFKSRILPFVPGGVCFSPTETLPPSDPRIRVEFAETAGLELRSDRPLSPECGCHQSTITTLRPIVARDSIAPTISGSAENGKSNQQSDESSRPRSFSRGPRGAARRQRATGSSIRSHV